MQPETDAAPINGKRIARAHTHKARIKKRIGLSTSLAALLVLCGAWAAQEPSGPGRADSTPVSIAAKPVPLDANDPARSRIGELAYLGGLELSSAADSFGGYSGLRFLPDGRMLAISDRGHWLAFRLVEQKGRLTGLADAVSGALLDETGQPMRYPHFDAEALEVVSSPEEGLQILVGFEQRHRIWRYALPETVPQQVGGAGRALQAVFDQRPHALPWLEDWKAGLGANAGLEAMAVRPDGAALLLAEGTGEGRYRLHAEAPWVPIRYTAEPGFKPTDAAFLPIKGRHLALVINRYFSILHGVAARLELVDLAAVKDGKLEGKLLARLAPPVSVDNMEAVEAVPHPDGGWSLYLMADDNQNPLQRTLLLKFHLPASAVSR